MCVLCMYFFRDTQIEKEHKVGWIGGEEEDLGGTEGRFLL